MIKWEDQTPTARTHELERWHNAVQGVPVKTSDGSPTVVLRAACRDAVLSHITGHREERGGLLLGFAFHDAQSPAVPSVIDVIDAVAAPTGTGTAVSLSMHTDLWQEARRRAERFDESARGDIKLMVVGWYHSHPGLGAFFSGTDRATQASFFRELWHLGLVVDPQRGEWAWFRSQDSIEIERQHVVDG